MIHLLVRRLCTLFNIGFLWRGRHGCWLLFNSGRCRNRMGASENCLVAVLASELSSHTYCVSPAISKYVKCWPTSVLKGRAFFRSSHLSRSGSCRQNGQSIAALKKALGLVLDAYMQLSCYPLCQDQELKRPAVCRAAHLSSNDNAPCIQRLRKRSQGASSHCRRGVNVL